MSVEIQSKEERHGVIQIMSDFFETNRDKLKKKNSTQLLATLHKAHLHPNHIREDMELDPYEMDGAIHSLLLRYIGYCKEWTQQELAAIDSEKQEAEVVAPEPENKPKNKPKKKGKSKKKAEAAGEVEATKTEAKPKKQSSSKQKKEKKPSAYGTAIELMAEDPNMDKTRLFTTMSAKGFDTEHNKGPINTAFLQFRKVYGLLKQNGLINEEVI